MWISRREWRRHVRELRKAERRAENAEYRFHELVNRHLTRQGSMGIPREPEAAAPQQSAVTSKAETVSGWTEEEYVEQLVSEGMVEGDARASWKRVKEVGLLPYQMTGELPS